MRLRNDREVREEQEDEHNLRLELCDNCPCDRDEDKMKRHKGHNNN